MLVHKVFSDIKLSHIGQKIYFYRTKASIIAKIKIRTAAPLEI